MLTSKQVKILAVYLSPSRPLIDYDPSACLDGRISVLMVVVWSTSTVILGWFLRNLTKGRSCLIDGSDIRNAVTYNSFATIDAPNIVITNDIVSPIYTNTCSALGSNRITVLFDKQWRSPIIIPADRPDVRTGWSKFQVRQKMGFRPNLTYLMSCLSMHESRKYQALCRRLCQNPIPNIAHMINHDLRHRLSFWI
jgi:hypothetical protein